MSAWEVFKHAPNLVVVRTWLAVIAGSIGVVYGLFAHDAVLLMAGFALLGSEPTAQSATLQPKS